ncbi:hypothetical protein DL770_009062 [Monosporascus sp. CRB-9-2]|nr:hypothetical protein DL770_009062 [Monosporascus sp. CRB-9-2]
MVPSPSTDPDETSSGRSTTLLLKSGTPREYATLEFHVSSKAGLLWEFVNPNAITVPPLLTNPTLPEPVNFQASAADEQALDQTNYMKYTRALKSYDRKLSLFRDQEKAIAEVIAFLDQSVHPDHQWVYWKEPTLREKLQALRAKFKPSYSSRIYEVDARYKEALKTNRIQMDTWLSKYSKAYTEAEELQIPAVAGFHGHLDFLKAVSAFSPAFSVTQTARVEEVMFDDEDATKLPTVQKLVEFFKYHMRLRKAQGAITEQFHVP